MILDWPDCTNVRDLGGLATTDGRRIRADALLRSDHHAKLTAETVAAIRAGEVRRIVDLRWARECALRPSPFAAEPIYAHVPLLGDNDYEILPDTYAAMLDHSRPGVAAAFREVAQAPPGAVVVHCHAGTDRTGVLVALLLLVAGVGADEVADDYALTAGTRRVVMVNTIEHLHRAYGGVAGYLAACDLEPALLDAVRSRLVE